MGRRRLFRFAVIGLAGLVPVVLVAALVLAVVVIRRPFPGYSGTVQVPGLSASVQVLRDGHGVPQIYADNPADLFRAQGYVQAQDRFFEMDWRRHVTAGRLSELVGANATALAADKVVRTLGWRQVAEQEYTQLDATTRGYLQSYTQGVNDYLAGRSSSQLSLNYTLLGLSVPLQRIEQWQPVDSLAWFEAMAWDLRGNYTAELDRARVYGSVKDVSRVEQLYPPYPYDRHAPILGAQARPVPSAASRIPAGGSSAGNSSAGSSAAGASPTAAGAEQARVDGASRALLAALGGGGAQQALSGALDAVSAVPSLLGGGDEVGSNSWVVSGALTATGRPLLANDPHLAPGLPGIWYQMGLHCRQPSAACPFDVSGYTFAGVPGVVIGHNARIAWGFTNLGPDVTDFYLEQVQGNSYLRDGKYLPLTTRTETIKVAGAAPVTITVRSTVHGPILSDVLDDVAAVGARAPTGRAAPARGSGYAVSLAWTALQPGQDAQALFALDTATDFASFRAAAVKMDAPAQNIIYADVDGHIGYQAPGRIPIRSGTPAGTPVPADGTWPMPGWDSAFDWTGYVRTSQLPYEEDPPEGYIVAANQAVVGPGYPVHFTKDWEYGYRSQRIRDLIAADVKAHRPITVADMQGIQGDTYNPIAPDLVPLLLKAKVDEFTAQGRDLLKGWDYTQPTDSAAAAYFNAVWAALLNITFADEMPEGTRPDGGNRWFEVVRTLLQDPQDPWWDNRSTPDVVETRDEVIRQALVKARLDLTSILGKDPTRWQWGQLHRLRLVSTPLGGLGSTLPLHPLLNRGPIQLAGGTSIVDAQGWDAASGNYDVNWGPSMRMVVDLADLDRSRWVNQTGQSDHPGQEYYADQLDAWAHNQTFGWPFSAAAVRAATKDTLTLQPAGGG